MNNVRLLAIICGKAAINRGEKDLTDSERQELKQAIRDYVESITERTHSKNRYVCPICGCKTDAFVLYPEIFYCHHCKESGDIFKLIQLCEHVDFQTSVKRAADIAGILLSDSQSLTPRERRTLIQQEQARRKEQAEKKSIIEDFEHWYNTAYDILCDYKRNAEFDRKGIYSDSAVYSDTVEKRLKEVEGYLRVFEDAETYNDIRTLFTSQIFNKELENFKLYNDYRAATRGDNNVS